MLLSSPRTVQHYVEKPETFVSQYINCGVYLFSIDIFTYLREIAEVVRTRAASDAGGAEDLNDNIAIDIGDCIYLEDDVLTRLAGSGALLQRPSNFFASDLLTRFSRPPGRLHVFHTAHWWAQIKTAGSAIYANRKYLETIRAMEDSSLLAVDSAAGPKIIGDVIVDSSAVISPSAVVSAAIPRAIRCNLCQFATQLGPNVSIGKGVKIGNGVRLKESIILPDATIGDHTLVRHAIVGWNNTIGAWSRVEGTPCEPNPNAEHAMTENCMLFNGDGKLNPSITVLGERHLRSPLTSDLRH